MTLAQLGAAGSSALFALLGAGITGFVTLTSLLVKYFLDLRTDRLRHEREVDAEQREQERTLERLRLELSEKRHDARQVHQTQALARFLAASLSVYAGVCSAWDEWQRTQDAAAYRAALRAVEGAEAQLALEETRLVASDQVSERASRLWHHLRGASIPAGQAFEKRQFREWREKYWTMRTELIASFQIEIRGSLPRTGPAEERDVPII